MDQMKFTDESQLLKDVTELKVNYKIERNALVKALNQPERYAGQRFEIIDSLVAIDGLLTALNKIMPDPPEAKAILYLDEDGAEKERHVDRATFGMWLSDIGSLVKFGPPGSKEI